MKIRRYRLYILISLLILTQAGRAQLSPGDLAQVHAHLEGMSNCTKCHTLGAKVSNDKCLSCHKEINVRVAQKKGYHSSSKVFGKSCTLCHSDHHGRNFEIIRFDKLKFDHNLAGYKLTGAHAEKKCEDCHKTANIKDPVIRKKKNTYLGLNALCLTCHEDYHQKTLSENCADCHDNVKFKPAGRFDHNKAGFRLKGKHLDTQCIDCHKKSTRNGKNFQQFTGFPFKNCTDCHTDPHNNKFGQQCTQCHSEESFRQLKGTNSFNHNQTRFPLTGRHSSVSCASCHKGNYTTPLAHQKCSDCHPDFHKGQFRQDNHIRDCRECHTDSGFGETIFTVEMHNQGSFPLNGAHLAIPCIACHKKTDNWSFREIGLVCRDCHEDIHKEYLDQKYYPGSDCRNCHSESSWAAITFDHSLTRFAITGAHANQSCRSCHAKQEQAEPGKISFTGTPQTCSSCHEDNHAGQYDVDGFTDCSRCHSSENWTLSGFDHNKTRFPLDGKHIHVACNDCHKMVEASPKPYRQYKFKDVKCENCH